jgi:hypothetical protein
MTMMGRLLLSAVLLPLTGHATLAHTSERGHVMLMPTSLYVTGGALAVAVSIMVVAFLPALFKRGHHPVELATVKCGMLASALPSLASLLAALFLIAAGVWGPFDPIANPLPAAIWTVWWIGMTVAVILFGNIWAAFNPWTGLYGLVFGADRHPVLRLPRWLGQWPAVAMLFGFAWLELVYPAPYDPFRLAVLAFSYLLLTFLGLVVFGRTWLDGVECFSIYFRMVSRLAALQWRLADGRLRLEFGWPGRALLHHGETTPDTAAFVILALSTVSFDGFMRTFTWVGYLGLNPLEFPGRSQVIGANTAGLLGMFILLAAAYVAAVRLGRWLAGSRVPGLVWSIVPIAFAYHLAHYLPDVPVSAMQFIRAASDPFGTGLDILGTSGFVPPSTFMTDHRIATIVYRSQTAVIVVGHVLAVLGAHAMALRSLPSPGAAILSQLPLNAVMVAYTVFGLWLLSTPVIG